MIISIENILNQEQLVHIRSLLAEADWQDGLLTAGQQASSVKYNQQLPQTSELNEYLGDQVLRGLSKHPMFISATLPLKIYPPMFNRYQTGNNYGLHVDNAMRVVPGTTVRVRTDLSATLFLNEPNEYEGGELRIEGQHDAREIKLNAGDMIIYPSTQRHTVKPVISGSRLASFFWIQSMVRNHEQRELLFNLDQSVQSLMTQHSQDHADVLRLTGVYQNLIRQWSDT
ncbi:Fe2+-dependent dioxygenase [Alkalimarinus alittae]|uniref:Fe2+-dependent dioxygenase n=1 Tax=Alkalimarinus alittae TaxID=2961619 RepID=A0ABY6MXJ6_9ALTE|nr:Fe2+-dependent dioxygenase [Alkalimarinus alittae]UZE94563.1 Fe2+-dependent dioxygenase [Alkalimarinus alittae]